MKQEDHCRNQSSLIAERRRNEPNELHPLRKINAVCKICKKPIMVRAKNLKPEGNCCPKCRMKDPPFKQIYAVGFKRRSDNKDWLNTQDERNKLNATDPLWREKVINGSRERSKDPEYLKKMSAALQGIPVEEWEAFTSFAPYCPKFNKIFKEGVRMLHGYNCALCGHQWQPGETKLSVHHVHNRKDSCCAKDAPVMFVCLCSKGCHQKITKNWRAYVDYFVEYINKNLNGKSYLTKIELDSAKPINAYAV